MSAAAFASAVGISRNPLREWHAFATVTTPGRPDFRLLISRAGDWTGRFIDDPPTHVWVRGKPDLLELTLGAVREFDTDAVFVVSNKPATTRLVGELERRGIPAFGPIWDS